MIYCRAERWGGHPLYFDSHGPHGFSYGPNDMYHGHCAGSAVNNFISPRTGQQKLAYEFYIGGFIMDGQRMAYPTRWSA